MRKAFISDVLIYGGVDFLWKFINFALFPLLALFLTVDEFGIYTLLSVQTWLLVMLINCGLHVSLEKFYLAAGSNENNRRELVSTSLSWLASYGLILVGFGLGAGYYYRSAFTEIPWNCFALALSTALPMSLFHYLCNVCRVNFSPWKYAGLHFLQNLLALGIGFSLLWFYQRGVAGLLWGSFISFSALLPLAYAWATPSLSIKFNYSLAKSALLFGFPFLFNDLARWTYGWLDRFWLEQFASLHDVGLFGMAFKLATPLIFLITAFSLAWTPYALKEANHRGRFLQQSHKAWFAFLTCCALPISLFSTEILQLLTPSPFWGAAPLVPLLAIGLVFLGSTTVTQVVLMHSNQTKKIALVAWLGGFVNCSANFYLIPRLGAEGAAISVLGTYAFIGCATLWLARETFTEFKAVGGCLIFLGLGWWGTDLSLAWKIGLLLFFTIGVLGLCFKDLRDSYTLNNFTAPHFNIE